MTRRLLSGASLLLSLAACESTPTVRPPTLDSGPDDVPVVTDRGADTGRDVSDGGTDVVTPDVPADVAMDVPVTDVPVTDVPTDTAPVDAPLGGFWCDLPGGEVPGASVPEGFCLRRFVRTRTPRVLKFAPNGDIFVASPSTGAPGGTPIGLAQILVFSDDDRNGLADGAPSVFASGLDNVHGLLFPRSGTELLFTLDDGVYRLPYRTGDRRASSTTPTVIANLDGWVRWTHTLGEAMDGSILVSMGQHDIGSCPLGAPRGGSVLRVRRTGPVGSGEIVARGFRNPMYLNCLPWGACYAAELSGDGWDSIGGREKLVELHDGDDYGYPCCVDRGMVVPGTPAGTDCSRITPSAQTFGLHDTPFGFDWERGAGWPAPYANGFFVGLHGFVGSWTNAGVQWAPTDPTTHRPTRTTEPFVRGWGIGAAVPGRIADLQFAPDGRMFFTDDQDGGIYWVAPRTLRMPAR